MLFADQDNICPSLIFWHFLLFSGFPKLTGIDSTVIYAEYFMDNSFRPRKFNSLKTIGCSFTTLDFSSLLIIKVIFSLNNYYLWERRQKLRGLAPPPFFLSFDSIISSEPKKWLSSFLVHPLMASITWKTKKNSGSSLVFFFKSKNYLSLQESIHPCRLVLLFNTCSFKIWSC